MGRSESKPALSDIGTVFVPSRSTSLSMERHLVHVRDPCLLEWRSPALCLTRQDPEVAGRKRPRRGSRGRRMRHNRRSGRRRSLVPFRSAVHLCEDLLACLSTPASSVVRPPVGQLKGQPDGLRAVRERRANTSDCKSRRPWSPSTHKRCRHGLADPPFAAASMQAGVRMLRCTMTNPTCTVFLAATAPARARK